MLYTSLIKDGALAEITHRRRLLDPVPTKPVMVHELQVSLKRVIEIKRDELSRFGIEFGEIGSTDYERSQDVGDITYRLLGCDGLLIPSARWSCSNLVVFEENLKFEAEVRVLRSEEVDWVEWGRVHIP